MELLREITQIRTTTPEKHVLYTCFLFSMHVFFLTPGPFFFFFKVYINPQRVLPTGRQQKGRHCFLPRKTASRCALCSMIEVDCGAKQRLFAVHTLKSTWNDRTAHLRAL